jgi:hypothetical protein
MRIHELGVWLVVSRSMATRWHAGCYIGLMPDDTHPAMTSPTSGPRGCIVCVFWYLRDEREWAVGRRCRLEHWGIQVSSGRACAG